MIRTQRKITWLKQDFINVLQELGPAFCVLSQTGNLFEFAISKKGLLSDRFTSSSNSLDGPLPLSSISGKRSHDRILSELNKILEQSDAAALLVRSFTDQMVCVVDKAKSNTLVRAQVKEIRGYQLYAVRENTGQKQFDYVHMPPDVVKGVYFQFDRKRSVNQREYRFV